MNMNKNMFLYSATHKNTAQAVILLRSTPALHWTSVTLSKHPPDVSSQDHPASKSTSAEVDEMGRNNLKMKFLFVESNKILLWVKFIWKLHFSFYSQSWLLRINVPTYSHMWEYCSRNTQATSVPGWLHGLAGKKEIDERIFFYVVAYHCHFTLQSFIPRVHFTS